MLSDVIIFLVSSNASRGNVQGGTGEYELENHPSTLAAAVAVASSYLIDLCAARQNGSAKTATSSLMILVGDLVVED